MAEPFTCCQLDNGLRIVVERMPHTKSAATGFLVRTGARDERRDQAGVSHFLEHMCFKGTRKRTWRQITIDFDEMGSTYNAFTSKDRTFYYGWVRQADITRQIELLADLLRPTLPPDEFEMEKKVVLEEIAMARDRIETLAYDLAHEKVFGEHALSWPVLGYEQTIRRLSREAMDRYYRRRYAADNIVLIVAGNVEPNEVIDVAAELCGAWEPARSGPQRVRPEIRTGTVVQQVERFHQQAVGMIFAAPGAPEADHETAEALAAILGGENSRFFWQITQKGIAHRAGAWRIDYADCGLLMLMGFCEPDQCERLAEAIQVQAHEITQHGAREHEVQRVKNKRRTSLGIEGESPWYRLLQIMDDIDYRGQPRTVEQRLAAVDAVTVDSIADYLRRFPITNDGYFVSVGPRDWPKL